MHEHQYLNYDGVMKCPCGAVMPTETTDSAPVEEVQTQTYPGESVSGVTNPDAVQEPTPTNDAPAGEPVSTVEPEPVQEPTPEVVGDGPAPDQADAPAERGEVQDLLAQFEHMVARLKQLLSR